MQEIRTVTLPAGESVPALGQGTWHLGENPDTRQAEIDAIRVGLDLGMTLIDTAEMYLGAEPLVGEAISGRRDQCFLVDKIEPMHATRYGMIEACEKSLRRLKTDRIDLYLLHWRGMLHLDDVVEAFERLIGAGSIRYWGVSNFHVEDMPELYRIVDVHPQVNQILYNLADRGAESTVIPYCRRHRLPLIAYSPLVEGTLLDDPVLRRVARRHDATPAQIALAWVLRHPDVIATPRAGNPDHVRDNRRAVDIRLTPRDLRELDGVADAPSYVVSLDMR